MLFAQVQEAPRLSARPASRFDQQLEQHPDLVLGELENGLRYAILPNRVPANRFEAHLEIHVGKYLGSCSFKPKLITAAWWPLQLRFVRCVHDPLGIITFLAQPADRRACHAASSTTQASYGAVAACSILHMAWHKQVAPWQPA